jgi:hypothetical protein
MPLVPLPLRDASAAFAMGEVAMGEVDCPPVVWAEGIDGPAGMVVPAMFAGGVIAGIADGGVLAWPIAAGDSDGRADEGAKVGVFLAVVADGATVLGPAVVAPLPFPRGPAETMTGGAGFSWIGPLTTLIGPGRVELPEAALVTG